MGLFDAAFGQADITPQGLGMPESMAFAATPAFSTIYAFGDSLSDAGNISRATFGFIPVSPPYSDGRFSNGPVWVQDLAGGLGLPAPSPILAGGNDYAFGGAETGTTVVHNANPSDLSAQLTYFRAAHHSADPRALYTVWAGSNDVMSALSAAPTAPNSTALTAINQAVLNEDAVISTLAGLGAKTFLVPFVPDIGRAPAYTTQGPAASAEASLLSSIFNSELVYSVNFMANILHFGVAYVNSYSLLDTVIANPSEFGFTNVTDPVWTGNFTDPHSGTLRATGAAQNQFLFWDSVHPTAAGHADFAAAALQTLSASGLA